MPDANKDANKFIILLEVFLNVIARHGKEEK
jgi:hypothetical protein